MIQPKPWGRIIIKTVNELRMSNFENLYKEKIYIGKDSSNDIIVDYNLVSRRHCLLEFDEGICYLTDLSINGTFVNDKRVGKLNKIILQDGDQISLVVKSRIDHTDHILRYTLSLVEQKEDSDCEEPPITKKIKTDDYLAELLCSVCTDLLYRPVSVTPCLHTFCGGCLCKWINMNHESCPNCRIKIQSQTKNIQIQNLIEIYLAENPDRQRPIQERQDLDRDMDQLQSYEFLQLPQWLQVVPQEQWINQHFFEVIFGSLALGSVFYLLVLIFKTRHFLEIILLGFLIYKAH